MQLHNKYTSANAFAFVCWFCCSSWKEALISTVVRLTVDLSKSFCYSCSFCYKQDLCLRGRLKYQDNGNYFKAFDFVRLITFAAK